MFRNFVLLLIIIFSVLLVFLVSTLFAHTFETFHVLPTAFALRVAHCFSWSCLLLRVLCCTRCGKQRVSIFHIYLKVAVVVNFLLWFFFFFFGTVEYCARHRVSAQLRVNVATELQAFDLSAFCVAPRRFVIVIFIRCCCCFSCMRARLFVCLLI